MANRLLLKRDVRNIAVISTRTAIGLQLVDLGRRQLLVSNPGDKGLIPVPRFLRLNQVNIELSMRLCGNTLPHRRSIFEPLISIIESFNKVSVIQITFYSENSPVALVLIALGSYFNQISRTRLAYTQRHNHWKGSDVRAVACQDKGILAWLREFLPAFDSLLSCCVDACDIDGSATLEMVERNFEDVFHAVLFSSPGYPNQQSTLSCDQVTYCCTRPRWGHRMYFSSWQRLPVLNRYRYSLLGYGVQFLLTSLGLEIGMPERLCILL